MKTTKVKFSGTSNTKASCKRATTFPLGKLPLELQRKVLQQLLVRIDCPLFIGWTEALVDEDYDTRTRVITSHVPVWPEILRTCKLYYAEGRRILYEENVFAFQTNAEGAGASTESSMCGDHPGIFDPYGYLEGVHGHFTSWATPAEFALGLKNSTANLIRNVYITECHGQTHCPHNLDFTPPSPSRLLVTACALFRRLKHATLAFHEPSSGITSMMREEGSILCRLPLKRLSWVFTEDSHSCWLEEMLKDPVKLRKLGWKLVCQKQELPLWFIEISCEETLGDITFMRAIQGAGAKMS